MPRTSSRGSPETVTRIEPEIFLQGIRRIRDTEVKKDEASAGVKAAIASVKNLGGDLTALKFIAKLERMDREKRGQVMRNIILYSKWLDLGLEDQGELFPVNSDLAGLTAKVASEHREWEAERLGYEAGKSAELAENCPFIPGDVMRQRYMTGWHDGAATRAQMEKDGVIKPKQSSSGNPEDGED